MLFFMVKIVIGAKLTPSGEVGSGIMNRSLVDGINRSKRQAMRKQHSVGCAQVCSLTKAAWQLDQLIKNGFFLFGENILVISL